MLVDPINFTTDERTATILAMIGNGRPNPSKLSTGVYAIEHFSMGMLLPGKVEFDGADADWHKYPELPAGDSYFGCCGVCDSPEQFAAHPLAQLLAASPRLFTVSMTRICKSDQPPDGGWRWHKWGEYIGEKSPQCEYIYDEPEITEVYVYHVYECLDASKVEQDVNVPARLLIPTRDLRAEAIAAGLTIAVDLDGEHDEHAEPKS